MNKKLRISISILISTMLLSEALIIQGISSVKAVGTNIASVQADYKVLSINSMGGFKLISKKWIEEIKSNVMLYNHEKSGARLIYIQNEDDNKVFSINFRTPTKDNTGVNHILEHSVLNGSKNYPVKDPFIQMRKQSLNTFLNAMTFPDMTMFPVASKNHKDFENLMSVYLDAVFYPNVEKNSKIFKQEGWRYELSSSQDELKYNGIVYNEMKGNYSSPENVLCEEITESLFPNVGYKYDSGGKPEGIPNLSYENFIKTYNEYYTPSNSYIYLYGNMDAEKILKFIGEKYLNNFDKKQVNTSIELQKPTMNQVIKEAEYSIPKDAKAKNKTYLSLNYVIDKITNKDNVVGFTVLKSLLMDTPSSPLLKALRDNGLAKGVYMQYNTSYLQPTFSIILANANIEDKDKFEKVVNETLQKLAKEGFSKELIKSVLNTYELSIRTVKGLSGLYYDEAVMRSWLYDADPTLYLNVDSDILKLKNKVNERYFENLIEKYLLNNAHKSVVILKPVQGLDKKKELEAKNKLQAYKASLTENEIQEMIKETKELKAWQETLDSKEAQSTLPTLSIADINPKGKEYRTIEKNEAEIKILNHPMFTNGVIYSNLYFDTSTVPQEKLPYLYMLEQILTNIDTKNYDKNKLVEEMLTNTGGISFNVTSISKHNDNEKYYPKLNVSLTTLSENLPKGFELLNEIIYRSDFNNKSRLRELVREIKMYKESEFVNNGSNIANERALSYISTEGKYDDFANNEFYSFICDLDDNFNNKSDSLVKNLKLVSDMVFNKKGLIVSYTGDENNYNNFVKAFNSFANNIKNESYPSYKYNFNTSKRNEGIIVPSEVQYVAKAADFKKSGYASSGKLDVLQNILESDYLWKNIRLKGGAYGANVAFTNKNVIFSSYRDPNLKETLDIFDNTYKYLKNFNANEREMTNYIIGTIGKIDGVTDNCGPSVDGLVADSLYMSGTSQKDLEKERKEILSTTSEDIKAMADMIEALMKQNSLCVVGGENKIEQNKNIFLSIKDVLTSKEQERNYRQLNKKNNVSHNKIWRIKFDGVLDEKTVNYANIYILDEKGSEVKIKLKYDKKSNIMSIEPEGPYDKGKTYILYMKDLQFKDNGEIGEKHIAPIKMEFSIKK
jgi:Zn-dependent M16 (insulinase) family peptidase